MLLSASNVSLGVEDLFQVEEPVKAAGKKGFTVVPCEEFARTISAKAAGPEKSCETASEVMPSGNEANHGAPSGKTCNTGDGVAPAIYTHSRSA